LIRLDDELSAGPTFQNKHDDEQHYYSY